MRIGAARMSVLFVLVILALVVVLGPKPVG